jgi:hypothetical protein
VGVAGTFLFFLFTNIKICVIIKMEALKDYEKED